MRRFVLALLVIAATLFAGVALLTASVLARKRPLPVRSTTHVSLRRTDCIDCHAPIAAEWRQSFHYRSLTGPHWKLVRELGYADLMERFRKPCVNCHAPANVLDLATTTPTGDLGVECSPNLFRDPPGTIPDARADDVALGVDCTSCHVSSHGIAGAGRTATTAHEIVADGRFRNPATISRTLCRTCHRATVEAWEKTSFAANNVTCLDCHMPPIRGASVAGGGDRIRRSHRFPADKDAAMLRNAVHASLDITPERQARFRIINDRVGHYFPSGGNFLLVRFTTYDGTNRRLAEQTERFGRREALWIDLGVRDGRIAAGERKEILVPLPAGHGRIEATIRYHDFMKDEKDVLTLQDRY